MGLAFLLNYLFLHYQVVNKMNLLISYLLSLLVTGVIAYALARSLTQPLEDMLPLTRRIARGDLEVRVDVQADDEFGLLASNLNNMVDRLRSNIREISAEKSKVDAILSSMSDGLLAVDQVGRVMLLNRAAAEMFSKQKEEVVGRYLLEVVRNHEIDQGVKDILESGKPVELELKLFPTTRQIFKIYGAPILNEQNRVVGAVLLIRNITEIRRLEQVRTEFVANVSHELRTPLTSIRGFVETLLEGALEDKNLCRRFLEIINNEAQRLQRLIEDLLTLSQLENRPPALPEKSVFLAKVLDKILEVVKPLASEKGITLETKLPSDLKPLSISENFLGQVLLNLLDNAIKYTPPGGRVTVAASAQDNNIRVEVSDTGIGIPPESLQRVFERFYRVDKARSREMGGTGLGLAIVKHIIESHKGSVGVTSEVGKGSTFFFTLPAAEN
ncbi:MAG: two-component system, OmpR family, phosphate regulon sensor histidine kinase PhoR [Clostridia bacterium]|nr:two-component system, OmpR family, phosphate regulon sensor histidine kinase PhoR [Clostridia bacterium]